MRKEPKLRVNLIYNLGYQIFAIVLPLITAPYVSRVLGADNIGRYSYIQACANYFFLFAMLGVSNYGNRTVASVRDDKEKLEKTFWEIYVFQFCVGGAVCLAYLIYCTYMVKQDNLIAYIQFFYVASGCLGINWLMFGLEQFKLITIRNIIIRIGMTLSIFIFVQDHGDLPVYTAIIALGNLISVLAIWPFVLKYIRFRLPNISRIVKHIKPNLLLFFPVVAVSFYNIMDKLMLGVMSTKIEVGFYTYAENITQIPNTLILAFDNVMLPRMANLYAAGQKEKALSLMDSVMMFAMMAAAAMSFGLAGIAPIFAPWFYGIEFARCGLFITLLCPIIIFKGWAGALRTQYIIPNKKDTVYLVSLTLGSIINLFVNYILIPKFQGVGAIIGTIAAEFMVAFIQFFMLRKEIPIKKYIANGVSFCLIGLIMYVIIHMISNMSILIHTPTLVIMAVQIICGAIVYLSLSAIYVIKIAKEPFLSNEALKLLHRRKDF